MLNPSQWADKDAAWAAAFIDAEGTVGIIPVKNTTSPAGVYFRCGVIISQVRPEPLDRLDRLLGGRCTRAVQRAGGNRRDSSQLRIFNQRMVIDVLRRLHPLLLTKQGQAEAVLAFRKAYPYRTGRATPEQVEAGYLAAAECKALTAGVPDPLRPISKLGEEGEAWLGGMVEGDGCIGIHRHPVGGVVLRLAVGTTDKAVSRRAKEVARVGQLAREPRKTRDLWRWTTTGSNALRVLGRIEPWLDYKKAHVAVARRLYAEGMQMGYKYSLSTGQLRAREQCYLAMRELNRRGRSV